MYKKILKWGTAGLISFSLLLGGCSWLSESGASVETTESAGTESAVLETEETGPAAKETAEEETNREKEETVETKEERNTEVSQGNGPLHVKGTQLCNEEDTAVQLRGLSTHGIAWFPQYVNKDAFQTFRDEWNVNVIRLAMYTAENGGYCTDGDKEELKDLIKDGVQYATELDMYVIIDWHILADGNPNTNKAKALAFFEEMSALYADYDNILYEICNEPNGGTSWSDVKAYAEEVIPVIRANDSDAVILVGTPNWCQYVDQAAADPITDYDNIMYTLHFYAATHTDDLRNKMKEALKAGLPIFVSEFGICDASGNGAIDTNQAAQWLDTMNELDVSYVAWNISNKDETSAILKTSCTKFGGFNEEDFSESGKWLYQVYSGETTLRPMDGEDLGKATEKKDATAGSGASGAGTAGAGLITSSGLAVDARVTNTWGEGDETFYQYNMSITNGTGKEIDDWKVTITFNDKIKLSEGWNGKYRDSGKTLTISNADYNGGIQNGETTGDIGFIVCGPKGLEITACQ